MREHWKPACPGEQVLLFSLSLRAARREAEARGLFGVLFQWGSGNDGGYWSVRKDTPEDQIFFHCTSARYCSYGGRP